MDERKESRYNLAGTCPKCGNVIKVEHIICVDLVELGTTTKTEGKDNGDQGSKEESGTGKPESADVRPADTKGPAGTTSADNQPAYSKKGGRNKNTGGDKAK